MPQRNTSTTFQESSRNQIIPDLSLHIRPPNSAPSSICTAKDDAGQAESLFDIWRKDEEQAEIIRSSHSDSSAIGAISPLADTELSLANHSTTASEAESPWRRSNSLSTREGDQEAQARFINHGFSMLDVSEKQLMTMNKPIKGIPVYNSFPFPLSLNIDEQRRSMASNKFSFYEMPYSSSCSSSSSSSASFYRPYHHNQFQYLNNHHHHHRNHQYGTITGASNSPDLSNSGGFLRSSRFMPKLQNKRNTRAPRMRWTSSLHARFIHAVELLGGHESKIKALICFTTFYWYC